MPQHRTALHAQISPESDPLLHRLYDSPDFEVKYFGPARWLEDGASYTTVEPSAAVPGARDIIRYTTSTGIAKFWFPRPDLFRRATRLHSPSKIYFVQGQIQTADLHELRAGVAPNTRGDYWVLDLHSGRCKNSAESAASR